MKRKLFFGAIFFCIGAVLFAQSVPGKVLSISDITNFIANFDVISDAMDSLEDDYDDYYGDMDDPAETMAMIRSKPAPKPIQQIMIDNGLGANGLEKVFVISIGAGAVMMEDLFFSQGIDLSNMDETEPFVEELIMMLDEMKSLIHKDDYKLIYDNSAELTSMLMGM